MSREGATGRSAPKQFALASSLQNRVRVFLQNRVCDGLTEQDRDGLSRGKRTRAAPLESGIEQRVFATGRRSLRGLGQSATTLLYVPKHDATLAETYLMLENWLINRTWPVCEGHLHLKDDL